MAGVGGGTGGWALAALENELEPALGGSVEQGVGGGALGTVDFAAGPELELELSGGFMVGVGGGAAGVDGFAQEGLLAAANENPYGVGLLATGVFAHQFASLREGAAGDSSWLWRGGSLHCHLEVGVSAGAGTGSGGGAGAGSGAAVAAAIGAFESSSAVSPTVPKRFIHWRTVPAVDAKFCESNVERGLSGTPKCGTAAAPAIASLLRLWRSMRCACKRWMRKEWTS